MAITVGTGPSGLSPYQVAVAGGYIGTEEEFNAALANVGNTTADEVTVPQPTAALYGLTGDATVDDVLQKIPDSSDMVGDVKVTARTDLGGGLVPL